ncbi:ABC transporter ATP-binding protein [Candidatus Bathyarchaeota archaeon]|nr:ABC transporter ATP-binding protein [Candidatus Bathyarchaeota archaeon]
MMIELRNISKTYNEVKALDNVNLEVHEGEILAVLGPSGSGKTTLLRILALIEKPSSGEVYFNGTKVTEGNIQELRMQTTMVFQKTVVFNTTVYKNVAYGLKLRKVPEDTIRKKVSDVLDLVGLRGFENRYANRLSGGEQQRVALARALVLHTKLVLLDEPTANLDPRNATIIEDVISTANHELGTTFVVATHNIFQAKSLPQRIALLRNGRIEQSGTAAEVFSSLSKTLASFAAVENTFVGDAKSSDGGTTVVEIGNGVQIETTAQVQGKAQVFIDPKEVIVSKKHFASSARNFFKGRIVEIVDAGNVVKVKVDVKGKLFTVQITRRSLDDLKLHVGSDVFLTFKASSVQVI